MDAVSAARTSRWYLQSGHFCGWDDRLVSKMPILGVGIAFACFGCADNPVGGGWSRYRARPPNAAGCLPRAAVAAASCARAAVLGGPVGGRDSGRAWVHGRHREIPNPSGVGPAARGPG